MITIKGKYNTAICYCAALEEAAAAQIRKVCDAAAYADSKIRIMPDVHAGTGCTIGTTMTLHGKVCPGMVGVDIGCGMETIRLSVKEVDFDRLDQVIRSSVPFGREVRDTPHTFSKEIDLATVI